MVTVNDHVSDEELEVEEEEVEEEDMEEEDEEECDEDPDEHEEESDDEKIDRTGVIKADLRLTNDANLEKSRRKEVVEADEGLTEATKAVLAAKRRQEEEKRQDYEERRRAEREQVEAELRSLREKQERRRLEREQEEKELVLKLQLAEERRRQDEENSRARIEAQKHKRDEERRKRQMMLAESLGGITLESTVPNFVIKKSDKSEKYGIAKKIQSKENEAVAKRAYMASLVKRIDPSKLLINDLRALIQKTHAQICELEASKYDLEKRHDRQLYDLKELNERERQVARHRALQRGLDPNEAAASRHPPKIHVASKFDRQFDRRSYGDRRTIFEKSAPVKSPSIAHGTARPPPEWGRSENEELDQLRKIIEPRRYNEQVKVDARPPIQPIPLNLPTD